MQCAACSEVQMPEGRVPLSPGTTVGPKHPWVAGPAGGMATPAGYSQDRAGSGKTTGRNRRPSLFSEDTFIF